MPRLAERVAEPVLVAARRQAEPPRAVGRARALPEQLDRRALRVAQPAADGVVRARHVVVDRARHRALVRDVARHDDERHAELLTAAVEELGGRPIEHVVLRRVGHEQRLVVVVAVLRASLVERLDAAHDRDAARLLDEERLVRAHERGRVRERRDAEQGEALRGRVLVLPAQQQLALHLRSRRDQRGGA